MASVAPLAETSYIARVRPSDADNAVDLPASWGNNSNHAWGFVMKNDRVESGNGICAIAHCWKA